MVHISKLKAKITIAARAVLKILFALHEDLKIKLVLSASNMTHGWRDGRVYRRTDGQKITN